jgi:hypothetical protein
MIAKTQSRTHYRPSSTCARHTRLTSHGRAGISSTIVGSPGEALLNDPGDKRPEMGYPRAATRLTEADADHTESASWLYASI